MEMYDFYVWTQTDFVLSIIGTNGKDYSISLHNSHVPQACTFYCTPDSRFKNDAFCPHNAFVCLT